MSKTYNSIPRDDFHNAAVKWSFRRFHKAWTGNRTSTIQVYEIIKKDGFDLHLSALYDQSGMNVTQIHFTIRKGEGKGNDAYAWFDVVGFNKAAKLGFRRNAKKIELFNDPIMPLEVKEHVNKIDFYAAEIFAEAVSYIKK